jgi:UDP-glucose 4-epimerase
MQKKIKILVTGGTGYIGSHTCVELIEAGFKVIIIDDQSNSTSASLDGIEKITGVRPEFHPFNLCEGEHLDAFFKSHKDLQGIIHFAAFKAVGESVQKPLAYYQNNLVSLMNLLEMMQKYEIPNLVFSSSCTVYGQPDTLPVTEAAPIKKAASPYGNTKQIGEEIIEDTLNANENLNGISLRYFNPIGAHESGLIGELPSGTPNNLMPFITQTAMGVRPVLNIYGNDYDTKDGTCLRDYIHVVDLAKAHVIAVERLLEEKNETTYEFFNIGTGKGSSVLEIIESFERTSEQKLNYEIVARRPGDVAKIFADTQLANEKLGWRAERDLDAMTRSAWNWEKKYREKQKS